MAARVALLEANYLVMTEEERADMFSLLSHSPFTANKSLESRKLQSTYEQLTAEIAAVQATLTREKEQGEADRTHLWTLKSTVQPGTSLQQVLGLIKPST